MDQVPDEVDSHMETSCIRSFPHAFRKAVFIVRSLEYTNLPLLSPEVCIDDSKLALPLLDIAPSSAPLHSFSSYQVSSGHSLL